MRGVRVLNELIYECQRSLEGIEHAKLDLDADPAANVQNVHLADVLATDQKLMVINTGTNDVVNLDLSGWSNSGTSTASGNHTYALWNNGAAHLLIDQNASVYQVL
jgi:hypothetical protein